MSVRARLASLLVIFALTSSAVSAEVFGEPRPLLPPGVGVSHVADLNGDGRDDLVTSSSPPGRIGIFLARPDGTLTEMPSFPGYGNVQSGDFDRDGKKDLVDIVGNWPGGSTVVVYRGQGNGTYQRIWSMGLAEAWLSYALGDLNADGQLDIGLFTDTHLRLPVAAMLGQGGTFAPPVVSDNAAYGVFVDVTGDGYVDLVGRARFHAPSQIVLPGRGDGSFASPRDLTESESLLSRAAGDFNGDGHVDVVDLRNIGDPEDYDSRGVLSVHFGSGEGTFLPPVESFVESAWYSDQSRSDLDFNGDGRDDLIYVTLAGHSEPHPSYVHLVFGTDSGAPDPIEAYFDGPPSRLVFGDFNGDGFADLVTVSIGYNPDTYVATLRLNTTFAFRSATFLQKPGGRLRVALDGANLSPDARVFIGDSDTPWTLVRYKSTQRLVLKGGEALERVFPQGVAVDVRVENPDGRTATVRVIR